LLLSALLRATVTSLSVAAAPSETPPPFPWVLLLATVSFRMVMVA
jgi:hypothetical protein